MRILLDHNVPTYVFRAFDPPDFATTEAREGWSALSNGVLLRSAESAGFDLLVTFDRGFEHQYNLSNRTIAIAILVPTSQERRSILSLVSSLKEGIADIRPGESLVLREGG